MVLRVCATFALPGMCATWFDHAKTASFQLRTKIWVLEPIGRRQKLILCVQGQKKQTYWMRAQHARIAHWRWNPGISATGWHTARSFCRFTTQFPVLRTCLDTLQQMLARSTWKKLPTSTLNFVHVQLFLMWAVAWEPLRTCCMNEKCKAYLYPQRFFQLLTMSRFLMLWSRGGSSLSDVTVTALYPLKMFKTSPLNLYVAVCVLFYCGQPMVISKT